MACYERRPPSGGNFNSGDSSGPIGRGFSNLRSFQLQRQARVKDERIVELETENALLHLKLAEYQERVGRSRHEAVWFYALLCGRQHWPSSAHPALVQLCHLIQKLKQDVEDFRSSFLGLLSTCQAQYQQHLSGMAAAVQRAQLGTESLQACQSEIFRLQLSLKEMDMRYHLEKQRRRELHNTLVKLKGNIRVHCRIRPLLLLDGELDDPVSHGSSSQEVAHAMDEETILVQCHRPGHPLINKTYNFERVYGPADSQTAVFADVCPLLTSLLDGYNVCIMAYRQTGSGKSYTMLGPGLPSDGHSDVGLIPRAVEELFRLISENPSGSPKVDVSIVEIYNNDVFDLLAKDNSTVVSGIKHEVVTTQDGWTEVPLLTRRAITSVLEFMELFHQGLQLRARNPTLVHADSSRSHLIITMTLTTATSLASIGVSGVTGLALRETSFINRSLAALADVLGTLSERRGHIPYWNSKLTHLLQDSIRGDAKLLVILCVSPGQKHVVETLQSLGFGTRARQVKRGQARKKPPHSQIKELCLGSA